MKGTIFDWINFVSFQFYLYSGSPLKDNWKYGKYGIFSKKNMGETCNFKLKTREEYGIFHDCLLPKKWPREKYQNNDVTSQYMFSQISCNSLFRFFEACFQLYFLFFSKTDRCFACCSLIFEASSILFLVESTNSLATLIPTISKF